jgi:lipoprotein-releasing system permease protein
LQELSATIKGVPGVTGAYPERQGIALATGANGRTGATVRAISPEIFTDSQAFSSLFAVEEGVARLSGERSALLGSKIAADLGIHARDTLRLIILRKTASGMILPSTASFTVEGVISSGYQELDARWVFIPFETGFSLLAGESSRTIIGVETLDPFSSTFRDNLRDINAILPQGYHAYSWDRINEAQFENFASTKTMLLFVMILIVLVAVVNISSALVILVIERRREIAILKSLGASSQGISLSFLLTALFAGLAGVIAGLPLGLAAAVNVNEIIAFIEKGVNKIAFFVYTFGNTSGEFIDVHLLDPAYYLNRIPVAIGFKSLFIIVAGTLVLSVLVGAVPAFRAGKERPIHILRRL